MSKLIDANEVRIVRSSENTRCRLKN